MKQSLRFYGSFGRFARQLLRTFSPRYSCAIEPEEEPAVYVCRHLNMHGPYTTIKWLPFDVHPMSLHVFFDPETSVNHYREYTFAARVGKAPKKRSLLAWLAGRVTCSLLHSLRAVPVYRDARAVKSMRGSLECLLKGESMIVWPDIDYTAGYEKNCTLYPGFLYMGELYHRRTGRELRFIPLYIDDAQRRIIPGEPMVINHYKEENESAAVRLARAIDRPAD